MAKYVRLNAVGVEKIEAELIARLEKIQGKRKTRIIGARQIIQALNIIDTEAPRRIRIYSPDGFVPNSYKYQCLISYVEATSEDGENYNIDVAVTGAKRSQGSGSLVVVSGGR